MFIERLVIRRLRGIEHASIQLHPKLTVLIGANNAGKTTVLDALGAVLSFRRGVIPFREVDFRMEAPGADVRTLKPIEVDVAIAPSKGEQFEPTEVPASITVSQNESGADRIYLRLTVEWNNDLSVKSIDARLWMLDGSGNVGTECAVFPLRDVLPYRGLAADRDLRRGIGGRWSDWGQILGGVRPGAEVLVDANLAFQQGTRKLVEGTEQLQMIARALSSAGNAVGLDSAQVKLSVVPQEAEELLQRMIIDMQFPGATRAFSAERHGMGTQGALLFAIYKLYVDHVLRAGGGSVTPVLTVEEPEAHLHPTAQRAMVKQLEGLPGQVIATSHSPEVVNGIQGATIVMRSRKGNSQPFQARLDEKTRRVLRLHPRVLFARSIMLVEGLEADLIPMFARAMNVDIDEHGVEVINAGGQDSIPGIWSVLGPQGYGFPIVCLADADHEDQLRHFLKRARPQAATSNSSPTQLIADLHNCDYFTCAWGEAIEHEIVDIAPDVVDSFFEKNGEPPFQAWRDNMAQQRLKRGGQIADLSDRDARVVRLSSCKSSMAPLAALLTQDGTVATFVPPRSIAAIQRAIALAKE